jgi:hypothetical protein
VVERNLGMVGRTPAVADRILASDATPATFWITNPANRYVDNVAAGSQGHGFWYALPAQPTGLSTGQPDRPTFTALGMFRDNVAHSNTRDGLHVDQGPLPDGTTATTSYRPRQGPNATSPAVVAVFQNFVAWKNANRGVWLRGTEHRMPGALFADNKIGATFASNQTWVEDATFTARPISLSRGTKPIPGSPLQPGAKPGWPQGDRLSSELSRLSPITNTWPGGTVKIGVSSRSRSSPNSWMRCERSSPGSCSLYCVAL